VATKLEQLTIRRVALVDKGANQEAFVTLFKREDSDMAQDQGISKADYDAAVAKAATLEAEVHKAVEEKAVAEQAAEEARTELAKRDEAMEIAKFDAQAKDLPFLGEKGGVWLRTIAKALGDEFAAFQTVLKAVTVQEETSNALLKEIGSDGDTEGSDFDSRVQAVAKRIMKEHPSFTQEQAYVKALEAPEIGVLYNEVRKTRGGK